jgi:cell division protein FtsB
MMRQRLALLIGAGFILASVAGCTGAADTRAELFRIRDRSKSQMDILKRKNELLNRQLNDMNEQVAELQESNDRLSAELGEYAARPEEVKLEIITEVNTMFSGVVTSQQDFKAQVDATVEEKTAAIEAELAEGLANLEKTLIQHGDFVHFVTSEQDSINRVFALRFDNRPWYQSVLGKWDDMERTMPEAP